MTECSQVRRPFRNLLLPWTDYIMAHSWQVKIAMVQVDLNIVGLGMT